MKKDWKKEKFEDVFDLQMGKTPSRDNPLYWDGTNTWVSISDMKDKKYISKSKEQISDVAVKDSGIKQVKKGTVIMSFKLSIGKTAIAEEELFTNEAIMAFNVREGYGITPDYIYYYLKGYKWDGANKAVMGATLNKKTIASNYFSYPSLPEQESIVAELDCLSEIIEKQKQQLKELDNLAQAIFYDMFGEEVAKTQEWATCTVGDVYKFQYGKGNKIPESKGEYPCYGSNGQVGYHTEYNGEDSPIIGHIGAYAGIVNWARGKHFVTYNGVICNLKNKEFDPIYAFYMLKAQNYMSKARGGAAQPFVSYDMLEEPIIFIPPLSLQQEFASKIEAIEKQKELIRQSLSETETLFNSRMDYYFN